MSAEQMKKQIEIAQNHHKPKKMPDPSRLAELVPEPVQQKVDKFRAMIKRTQVDRKGRTLGTTLYEQEMDQRGKIRLTKKKEPPQLIELLGLKSQLTQNSKEFDPNSTTRSG